MGVSTKKVPNSITLMMSRLRNGSWDDVERPQGESQKVASTEEVEEVKGSYSG